MVQKWYNSWSDIHSNTIKWKDKLQKLFIQIYKDDIDVLFADKVISETIKANGFNIKLYHIPLELLKNFDMKHREYRSKKIVEIKKDMKQILMQESDWKDQLKIIPKLAPLSQKISSLSWTHPVQNIIENYIYNRLFYKVMRQDRHYKQGEKDRVKTLTTGEKIQKFTPELKKIIDTIIEDIHKEFKIQIKKKDQDPFRKEKYLKKEKDVNKHNEHLVKKFWIAHNLDQYTLENIPLSIREQEDWKDEPFHTDSIYKIIPRKQKLHKTSNQSKKKK